jgi:hypothetical protein
VVEQMFYAGRQEMAIVRVTPTQVDVSCGFFDGRPRHIRIANENVPVIEIAQVRDELRAYPVARGPRRIFDVRTADARLRLSYERRRRRWFLEGLEAA